MQCGTAAAAAACTSKVSARLLRTARRNAATLRSGQLALCRPGSGGWCSTRMPPHSMTPVCKMLPRGCAQPVPISAVGPTGGGMAAGKSTVREIIGKDVFWSQVLPQVHAAMKGAEA